MISSDMFKMAWFETLSGPLPYECGHIGAASPYEPNIELCLLHTFQRRVGCPLRPDLV
jgi:hypothetical protein